MYAYKDKIILEVGGHDHMEDLRIFNSNSKGPYRNLFIGCAVSPDHEQMPGFNTFAIEGDEMVPRDLRLTTIDLEATYGKNPAPPLSEVPVRHLQFTDYGIDSLTAEALSSSFSKFDSESFQDQLKFLTTKEGFDPADAHEDAEGISLLNSWGLLNNDHTSIASYYCQQERAKDPVKMQACLDQTKRLMVNMIQ